MVGGYFVLLTPVEGQEQPPPDVFTPVDASGWVDPQLPDDAILRSRPVAVNMATLALVTPPNPNAAVPAVPVRFNLFDDVIVTVVFHKAKPRYDIQIPDNPFDLLGQDFEPVGYTWSGDIVGDHGGYAIMVTHGAKCVASVHVTDVGSFMVRPIPGGQHVVRELDASLPLECGTESQVSSLGEGAAAGGGCVDEDAAGCDDGSVIDIMVVYTPAARGAMGGETEIEMMVDVAIQEANDAYNRSEVDTSMRLVYTGVIAYPSDPPGYPLDNLRYQWDGWLDDVHPLRNALRADLVSLLVRDGSQGPSVAHIPDTQSPYYENRAFSIVRDAQAILGDHHFVHETGHSLGCAHDRAAHCSCGNCGACSEDRCTDNCDCQDGICVFSYGHKFGPNAQTYKTIMATFPGSLEPYYSNPAVLGPLKAPRYPTGVPFDDPGCNSADCAQTINIMRDTVANYRQSCDTTDTTNIATNDYYTGQANADSTSVSISDNGQYIAFASDATTDWIQGGQDGFSDIYMFNRESGLASLVSLHAGGDPTGDSYSPAASGNGHFVAFTSDAEDIRATGSGAQDGNNLADIYVWEQPEQPPLPSPTIRRISLNSAEEEAIGGDSTSPSISYYGRFVVFASDATNLVENDTLGYTDIFRRDRDVNEDLEFDDADDSRTGRISVGQGIGANGDSYSPAISSSAESNVDGRFVAFVSDATNLVDDDTNIYSDIFVRSLPDFLVAETSRVSVSTDPLNPDPNGPSFAPSISGDGRFVAFESDATNLVVPDTLGHRDIFVRDTILDTTIRISVAFDGTEANGDSSGAVISADQRLVAFQSDATNLLGPGIDTNGQTDVFVYELETGEISRPNISSAGAQATGGGSFAPAISGHGRFIAFESDATNLVPDDAGGFRDIFFRDRGISCVADFNGDGEVDGWDLAVLLGSWGQPDPCTPYLVTDLDQDCTVGPLDLAILLARMGPCP